jgi:di/tricarboxylate transporter
MSPDAILVAVLAVTALGLAVSGRASLDVIGLGLLAAVVLSGLVELDDALAGFSNHAVITLAGLYVLGEGLAFTGALNFVARRLTEASGGSPWRVISALCLLAALISGIASNTAVVLVFIPLTIELARKLQVSVTHLLMPVAAASILGGTLTLVGSTTNLLTSGAGEAFGAEPLELFSMTPVAAVLCVVIIPLGIWLPRKLLAPRRTLTESLAKASVREFVTEMSVGAESPLCGRPLADCFASDGVRPLMLARGGAVHWPPFDKVGAAGGKPVVAEEGDSVMLAGRVDRLLELQNELGLEFLGDTRFDPRTMELFELVLAPTSSLIGLRLGKLRLWRDLGVLVVAVLRGGHHIRERASEMRLRQGDVLLVSGPPESESRIARSQDFYRITGVTTEARLRRRARRALWITLGVVLAFLAGTVPALRGLLPIPLVALAGAAAMVAGRCLNTRRAYRCIGWPILIFVVGALALGEAMEATGLSADLANGVVSLFEGFGPRGTLAGLLLAGTLLNQFVSPYAVSVLLAPVAISTANAIGAPVEPFLLAVAFAGSNAFATPLGHQVNLLVLEPGGYRYGDFLKVGLPLTVVYWLVASAGLAMYL